MEIHFLLVLHWNWLALHAPVEKQLKSLQNFYDHHSAPNVIKLFCYHTPFHWGRLLGLCVMKRILDASLLWSVNVCLLIEVLHTPGIYNLAKWSSMAFCEAACSAFHNFLLWRWAHKAFHVYLHVCLLNLHVRYLDFQRLYFCYVQRVEAINRFFLYRWIRVITKLPNSEQSYKGKVKTHKLVIVTV